MFDAYGFQEPPERVNFKKYAEAWYSLAEETERIAGRTLATQYIFGQNEPDFSFCEGQQDFCYYHELYDMHSDVILWHVILTLGFVNITRGYVNCIHIASVKSAVLIPFMYDWLVWSDPVASFLPSCRIKIIG